MKARLCLSLVMAAVLLIGLVGCKKEDDTETVEVKSQAEYKARADEEITETNMQQELSRLETEIEADTE